MVYPTFSRHLHTGYTVRPKVWISALATAVLVGIYLSLASMLVKVSSPEAVAVAAHASAITQATPVVTTSSVPSCTPTAPTNLSSISLSGAPVGLTDRTDTAELYRIYGDTPDQLRNQIRSCAPGHEGDGGAGYTAVTAYTMSWQYDTFVSGGTCRTTNVKVGVHIRMTLPQWEPTASARSGLAAKWQDFMNALTAHETGHATLDAQYAGKLTADLNGLPAMDCDALRSAAQQVADADIAALNQANENYDASTSHGATQGAVLPQ